MSTTFNLWGNIITLNFSIPLAETGFIGEDFNYKIKTSYATTGIQSILKFDNDISLQMIIGTIFQAFYSEAQKNKLDYLQTPTINGVEVFLIDNGESICLMLKEEY